VTGDEHAQDQIGLAVLAAQPGGAAAGVVDDVDPKSAALLGKHVLIGPSDPCGQCEVCRRGGAAVCPHARRHEPLAPRRRVAARWAVALGDGLELPVPAAAAVAGDVALAYTLYARTGLSPREPVVVLGATGVTRFLIEILIAKSIAPIVIAGDDPAWCDWLLGKGAALARTADDVRAAVAAAGLGARPWRILATGADHALACALAGPRATLTALAPAADLPGALVAREVTVIGVAGAHPDLVVEAAAMCVKGEIDLPGGVTGDPADATRARVIALSGTSGR